MGFSSSVLSADVAQWQETGNAGSSPAISSNMPEVQGIG